MPKSKCFIAVVVDEQEKFPSRGIMWTFTVWASSKKAAERKVIDRLISAEGYEVPEELFEDGTYVVVVTQSQMLPTL